MPIHIHTYSIKNYKKKESKQKLFRLSNAPSPIMFICDSGHLDLGFFFFKNPSRKMKKFFNNKKTRSFFSLKKHTQSTYTVLRLDMRLFKHKIFIPAIFLRKKSWNIKTHKSTHEEFPFIFFHSVWYIEEEKWRKTYRNFPFLASQKSFNSKSRHVLFFWVYLVRTNKNSTKLKSFWQCFQNKLTFHTETIRCWNVSFPKNHRIFSMIFFRLLLIWIMFSKVLLGEVSLDESIDINLSRCHKWHRIKC